MSPLIHWLQNNICGAYIHLHAYIPAATTPLRSQRSHWSLCNTCFYWQSRFFFTDIHMCVVCMFFLIYFFEIFFYVIVFMYVYVHVYLLYTFSKSQTTHCGKVSWHVARSLSMLCGINDCCNVCVCHSRSLAIVSFPALLHATLQCIVAHVVSS